MSYRLLFRVVFAISLTACLRGAEPTEWSKQMAIAVRSTNSGDLVTAEAAYRSALRLAEQTPDKTEDLALTLNNFGQFLLRTQKYPEGEAVLTRLVALRDKQGDRAALFQAQEALAALYLRSGKVKQATEILKPLVESQKDEDRTSLAYARLALGLATAYEQSGEHRDADIYFWSSLRAYQKNLPPSHPVVANALRAAATWDASQLNQVKARTDPAAARAMVIHLGRIADLFGEFGGGPEGEVYIRESLEVRKRLMGQDNPAVALSLRNLGSFLKAQQKYAEAADAFRQALEITQKRCDDPASQIAPLKQLAESTALSGDVAQAETLWESITRLQQQVYGANHPHAVFGLREAANQMCRFGSEEGAERFWNLHTQALENYERTMPRVQPFGVPVDRKAKLVRQTKPVFPATASYLLYESTVSMTVDILEDGSVGNVHVVRCAGSDLDPAAVRAIRNWRYEPAIVDGRAARIPATIEANFGLRQD